jgi:hypothetical protein
MAIVVVSGQQISFIPNGAHFTNPGGTSQTYSTVGKGIDLTGPFFQSLGKNGRSCATCHQPSDGMSVCRECAGAFSATQGQDPIFRTVDGSNCNHSIDVSALAGKTAAIACCSRLDSHEPPANADYKVVSVNNQYG